MAISFIGAGAGDGTTITVPVGHQAGDAIFVFAFRTATTAPTIGTGFTSITSASSSASSHRVGYKIAASSADTSGTWTNATGLAIAVYRGTATNKVPFANQTLQLGSTPGLNFPAINPLQESTSSWVLGWAGLKATDTTTMTTPALDMTNIAFTVGATCSYVLHHTNAPYSSSTATNIGKYAGNNVTTGGTAAEFRSGTIEIFPEQLNINNYQSIKVASGLSAIERIK